MWGIAPQKIGRAAVKDQSKSDILLFNHSIACLFALWRIESKI
jgi:hypothetical protein